MDVEGMDVEGIDTDGIDIEGDVDTCVGGGNISACVNCLIICVGCSSILSVACALGILSMSILSLISLNIYPLGIVL
jgi:hypothetical protein